MTSPSSVARIFDAAAQTYEATGTACFDPMGQRLVDLAGIQPGHRVLDVGTGRGAVLRPWSAVVTPSRRLALSWWAGDDERYTALGAAVAHHLPDTGPHAPRAFSGDAELALSADPDGSLLYQPRADFTTARARQ